MKDKKDVVDFIKKAGVYYLATMDGDQPRVRPFGTVNLYNDKVYIQTGKVKDVSKQIAKNPKVEISAFADGAWIRVCGTIVNDDSIDAKKSMLDSYPDLKAMYDAEDDNTQVLYFENATATLSSFTAPPEVVEF